MQQPEGVRSRGVNPSGDPSLESMDRGVEKPPWLRVRLPSGGRWAWVRQIVRDHRLHTVCEEALCPNQGQCWEQGRATFLILGEHCSRHCAFCHVRSEPPGPPDVDEPARVAEAVRALRLREVVLTSVTRDDLPDGGAALWAETIRRIREAVPHARIEVLIPDFRGRWKDLDTVLSTEPDVVGHNLETVPSRYEQVRPEADYERSLAVLRRAHRAGRVTKTGLMLGLGETFGEVLTVMREAKEAGCDIFFAGQYLRPSPAHLPVDRYVTPEEFQAIEEAGRHMGFAVVLAAPLVRSSFHCPEQDLWLEARARGSGRRNG